MTFTFGLGSDTMIGQLQKDTTLFKLSDMSTNIQKRNVANGNSAAYVDYSFSHLSRFMLQDEANDNAATFLYEYQALLRSRIQELITSLTAAMTKDLDNALSMTRSDWEQSGRFRSASQGYTGTTEDAGAARVSYNYFTGYTTTATPAGGGTDTAPSTTPYAGAVMPDGLQRVSPDTQADAAFGGVAIGAAGDANSLGGLRVTGTATIQQGVAEDGFQDALLDILNVTHQNNSVRYRETGGGFIAHLNKYKFTDVDASAAVVPTDTSTPRFNLQNINYSNTRNARNLNDDEWDGTLALTSQSERFTANARAKNQFQRILFQAIAEFDQKNYLRDMFRLSEQNGYFNNVQIASTSSLNSGSQAQHSLYLDFVPDNASRPDLGGQIRLVFDRWSAFFHS
jgi:hypothetical protein